MPSNLIPERLDDLEAQSPSLHSRTPTILGDGPSARDEHDPDLDEKRSSIRRNSSSSTLASARDARLEAKPQVAVGARNEGFRQRAPDDSDSDSRVDHGQVAEKANAFQVGWDGPDDPANPQNWSRASRWYYTLLGSVLVFNATFASSSPGGIVDKVMKEFTFSTEIATLMISLFVAGYCVGPLFWGPLSEIYGRRPIFIVSFILYTGFQVGCALSPNTAAILTFRFLGGCAASSPLANAGAVMSDVWDQKTRGKALALFTLAPFAGPAVGPVVGGFIGVSKTASWRWLFWVLTIFSGSCLVLVFTLPETCAPVILKHKAERLRRETGDTRYFAPIETQKVTIGERARNVVMKPMKMLFYEPMLLAVTLYMSFVYGCLYVLFEAYPIVFIEGHGFNSGENGLAFLPLFVGALIGTSISILYVNPRYVKLVEQYAPRHPPPEERLPMGVLGGIIFAICFFWFGWTSYPSVSYWAPLLSGVAFGVSLMFLFQSLFNYMIDVYLSEAASALSASTIVRSLFGATFPLFASQMYKALNPRWASTLLGCVAVLMIPIPVLFIRYGPALRKRSRFSPSA